MTRIPDHGWKEAVKVLKAAGFRIERTKGSHLVLWKKGIIRPVIVPKYGSLPPFIVSNIINTAGIGRKRYRDLMKK